MSYVHIEYPKIIRHPTQPLKRTVVDEIEEAEVLAEWQVDGEEVKVAADPFRDQLLARAARIALDVNPRWTDKRLLSEVEKAEATVHAEG